MKKRILAIGAHPDDIEIGCGGTMRFLADQGCEIKFIVVTSGEEGALEGKQLLRQKREDEAKKSALILGASEVIFFREPDGLTNYSKETKSRLIQIIREFKPEIAFIHSSYDCFPDHKIISDLSRSAIQVAGGPWYADAGAATHKVHDVFGFEVWNPNQQPQMSIDITETIENKLKALECHQTQTANINYLGAVRGLNEYRGATAMNGKYAESFEIIQLGNKL